MNKKLMFVPTLLLMWGCQFASAADFVADSKARMLKYVNVAYFQHYCETDKVHEGLFALPVGGYGDIGFDAFARVGAHNNEIGMSFPTKVNDWVSVTPLIYHDFTVNDVGLGVSATFRLR